MKNEIYIKTKKEKTISEIRTIRREFKNSPVPALYIGFSNSKKILATKFYQLSILKKIENNSQYVLKKWLSLSKKKLCPSCKKGLKHGDLRCNQCLRIFIFADMIRRSIS